MARFDIGDDVVNANLYDEADFNLTGTITHIHTGHVRGDGYTISLDKGGTAMWYDHEVQKFDRKKTPKPEIKRKKRFGIF